MRIGSVGASGNASEGYVVDEEVGKAGRDAGVIEIHVLLVEIWRANQDA